jgi:hypothetical protein
MCYFEFLNHPSVRSRRFIAAWRAARKNALPEKNQESITYLARAGKRPRFGPNSRPDPRPPAKDKNGS